MTKKRHPATWVPTAYVAEGIPFAIVNHFTSERVLTGETCKDQPLNHGKRKLNIMIADHQNELAPFFRNEMREGLPDGFE